MSAPVDVLAVMDRISGMFTSDWHADHVRDLASARAATAELIEKSRQLQLIIGLTAIKHQGQLEVLQQAYSEMDAAITRAGGAA